MSDYMPYTAEHYIRRCESCPENEGFCTRIAADKCETYFLGEEVGLGHLTVLSRMRQDDDLPQDTQPAPLKVQIAAEKIIVNPKFL